ncbi:NAD-glutamate dehydrogenase [Agaribacterium sp. ZY112]|uniref:NAD-glutamate dehydrogenase n=1 Tax=Agaribacterium sp. ZY112 TaxID=3233574 RepID=UPI00352315E1
MEIAQKHLEQIANLLKELDALAPQDAKAAKQEQDWVRLMLEQFSLADWVGRPISDLRQALLNCYCFSAGRQAKEPVCRVFNPELQRDGWVCPRTVVLFNYEDYPFLVDSLRLVLEQSELAIHVVSSKIIEVQRSETGFSHFTLATEKPSKRKNSIRETFAYFEISAIDDAHQRDALSKRLIDAAQDVAVVVSDYPAMTNKLDECIAELKQVKADSESLAFLSWLKSSNFTFLGYRDLSFDQVLQSGKRIEAEVLEEDKDARLGIFKAIDCESLCLPAMQFVSGAANFYQSDEVLCFSKSRTRSTVHRHVYPDYVVVKKYDDQGQVCGERRFLGFYTYAVSSMSPTDIPILRKRVEHVIERSGLNPRSHDGKRLMRCIHLHPKEELFQATAEQLYQSIKRIVELNERDIIRLLARPDAFGQFVSCLVYVPRELYTTKLRLKIQQLIGEEIGSDDGDSNTFFSESKHARAHIVFRLRDSDKIDLDVDELERRVADLAKGWQEQFKRALDDGLGEAKAVKYYKLWVEAFPHAYKESFDARTAVDDIETFEQLETRENISVQLYQPQGYGEEQLKFRVAHLRDMLELSDVIPILENMGLRVLGEEPFQIRRADGEVFWLHDFQLQGSNSSVNDITLIKQKFEQCFKHAWQGHHESDGFNRLVLSAQLDWREVNLLRAYAHYMKQTRFELSLDYISDSLVLYPSLTKHLITLFDKRFNPELSLSTELRDEQAARLVEALNTELDNVAVLSQEQVFRRYIELIEASLRVNFYQRGDNDEHSPCTVLKFEPNKIADIPEPKPAFEFFVYSSRVEGVHLRTSKVARGGLRWSDRIEDYRTEVLGLVKAQQVKNSVIVPSGAKGGFVAKQLDRSASRADQLAEGIECYRLFIRSLLELTDNLVEGQVKRPERLICRDGDDAYLVVAADKGTATFSDIANEISIEKGHWLGDAFASGGSQGYDHKAMGITARGAWVSVQRLFREQGLNTQTDPFKVIGIGDMGGDVFGNGMLLSEQICLVAAFNHLHIFIDPSPDPQKSYQERQRLFEGPASGWSDYKKELISKGGGVWLRSDKFIELTAEVKQLTGLNVSRLTPNELIKSLLRAEVDLLWNGGIGTYVKSEQESHANVGDKANDCLRVNGSELRAKVFGEGGNLGLTQNGRIEFSQNGGACNTDFIDNAAGVDCSDHEVNIKILIDAQVENGDLTEKQRNKLLQEMTDDVSNLVLANNYRQTLALSLAESQVLNRMNEYRRFIVQLEESGRLDRSLEYLPADELLLERIAQGQGLVRPELCVLISYAKVQLKEALSDSDIANDNYCAQAVFNLFPAKLHDTYVDEIQKHKLRKQIIATQLANDFVNHLGITSFYRLSEISGSSPEEVVKAYVVARDVFSLHEFFSYIGSLDYKLEAKLQHSLLSTMLRRVRRGTSWFLKNRRSGLDVAHEIKAFANKLREAQACVGKLLPEAHKAHWAEGIEQHKQDGIDDCWLDSIQMPDSLFSGLGVVEVSNQSGADIKACVETFIELMHTLKLDWFANQLSKIKVDSFWQASAREAYIDDLEAQLRKLSICLLSERYSGDIGKRVACWHEQNDTMVRRWTTMVTKVEGSNKADYAMFSVALRELNDLVQVTIHN